MCAAFALWALHNFQISSGGATGGQWQGHRGQLPLLPATPLAPPMLFSGSLFLCMFYAFSHVCDVEAEYHPLIACGIFFVLETHGLPESVVA